MSYHNNSTENSLIEQIADWLFSILTTSLVIGLLLALI